MNLHNRERVAPILALLVISIIVIVMLLNNRTSTNTNINAQSTPSDIIVVPTAAPPLNANTYDYHVSQNQLQLALYHLEADASRVGWTAQDHIRAGNLWRDMGDLGRALPHWEAAIITEPNANLLRQIADIYIERGAWNIAWERIQVLLTLTPNNAWALYHGGLIIAPSDPATAFGYLGRVAASDSDFADVAQSVLDAIGDTQTNSDVILRVGTQLAAAEEWSLAENAFQYASDLYYPFAESTAYVGLMRILQGKNGERWITEAITIDSQNAVVRYIAGVYWRSAGDFLKSESELINAVILDSDNPSYHAELGNTYRATGNYLDAEVWLQTAVILSDSDPLFVEVLEQFYADENFSQTQAIIGIQPDSVETTDAINPIATNQDPSAISASGWAAYLQGNTEAGLLYIEQALAIQPDNPRALFDKARIFLETDRVAEAIPLLQQVANGESVFAGPAQGLLDREQN